MTDTKYATCDFCGRQMHYNGCVKHWYIINNETYEALKQGEDGNEGVCPDCGAKPGEYHHPGCDMERCPVCHTQLITCSCGKEIRNNQTMAGQSVILQMLDAGVNPRAIIEMAYEAKGKPVPDIDFNGLSHGQLMDMIEELAEDAAGNTEESP